MIKTERVSHRKITAKDQSGTLIGYYTSEYDGYFVFQPVVGESELKPYLDEIWKKLNLIDEDQRNGREIKMYEK